MSIKCGKCEVSLVGVELLVQCVECALTFHPACTRLGAVTKNISKTKAKSWKCDQCYGDSASVKSNDDTSEETGPKTILEALQSVKNDINSNIDKKIEEIKGTISSLADTLQQLNTKFTGLESAQQELKGKCDQLEQNQDELQVKMREIKINTLEADQHARCANIEIGGIPHSNGENVYEILHKISTLLEVSYKREDVSIAHRLRLFSKKHKYPPIIAQFVSRSVKEVWLSAARKKKGFDARDVAASFAQGQVYLNDHLTSHNKMLLGRARRLQREGKIHFATFANGKVLIKARETDSTTRVYFVEDLDRYDKHPSKTNL